MATTGDAKSAAIGISANRTPAARLEGLLAHVPVAKHKTLTAAWATIEAILSDLPAATQEEARRAALLALSNGGPELRLPSRSRSVDANS